MFKDKYTRANDRIEPSNEVKEKTLSAICEKDGKKRSKLGVRATFRVATATVLCICTVILAVMYIPGFGLFASKNGEFDGRNGALDGAMINTAANYDEIFEAMSSYANLRNDKAISEVVTDSVGQQPESSKEPANDGSSDYSKTNTQVDGVDEADVIKTDGKHIYVLNGEKVSILMPNGVDSEKVSEIYANTNKDDPENVSFEEMYLSGDLLIIVARVYNDYKSSEEYFSWYSDSTAAYFYDISDATTPKYLNRLAQDGSYNDSRVSGNVLYLVSVYYCYNEITRDDPKTFVPQTYCGDAEGSLVLPNDITIMSKDEDNSSYTVITAVDLENTDSFSSKIALLGSVYGMYSSTESMVFYRQTHKYVTEEVVYYDDGSYVLKDAATEGKTGVEALHDSTEVKTDLFLIDMNDGKLSTRAKATIAGTPLNQFSIDEYNGYYRIVVTQSKWESICSISWSDDGDMIYEKQLFGNEERYNALYVLDGSLKVVGSIEGLAEDERVYSVRFMGDTAYFVTFRNTDPLFSVDLSQPTSPKILGSLKIPGFSNYLHPYGENLLFGFGMTADEETGWAENLKLSMFDVTDKTDVKEIAKNELIEFTFSDASYDHKAIVISVDKNIIAFPVENGYAIYSYDSENSAFVKKGLITPKDTGMSNDNGIEVYRYYDLRGLYIGDDFYIIDRTNSQMWSVDLNTFECSETIRF